MIDWNVAIDMVSVVACSWGIAKVILIGGRSFYFWIKMYLFLMMGNIKV